MPDDLEERAVSKEEVKGGVQLRAGHSVRLIVSGLLGTPQPPPPAKPGAEKPGPAALPPQQDPPAQATPANPGNPAPANPANGAPAQPGGAAPAGSDPAKDPPESKATPALLATLEDLHFEFDKTFPLPSVIDTCRLVVEVAQHDPERQLVVVGHTDFVGDPTYNLHLSDQRAAAIAAYLHDDVDALLSFYSSKPAGQPWGAREDDVMLGALPHGGTPFLRAGVNRTQAIRGFQKTHGLKVDGAAGPKTRSALLTDYVAAPGTSLPQSRSLRTLGCGQRHPPQDPAAKSVAARWRRVEIFLFENDPQPSPDACASGAHPGCTVHDQWLKEALPLGSDEKVPSVRIHGPRPRFPCFLMNAAGPIVIGGPVTTDCKLVEGSNALFVLKDDGTGRVRGLPAGAYRLLVGSGAVPDANGDGIPDAIPLAAVWQRGAIVEVQVAGAGETDVELPAPPA